MRFRNNVIDKNIAKAVFQAEMLLIPQSKMIAAIKLKNDFEFNSGIGESVATRLLQQREPVNIWMYKPFWRWSSALGYSDGVAIFINQRRLGSLDINELTGLLIHEYSHIQNFTHGSNYPSEFKNKHSVPYWLSENISKGEWL